MIAWFVRNGVAANLLMFFIVGGGLISLSNMKMELFPEFELDFITIRVAYPGATPVEVEESVCIKIEEAIQDLEGIKEMTSSAMEGMGVVTIEIESGYDSRDMLSDVKSRVDAINTFPDDAEKPVIQLPSIPSEVLTISLYGPADERTLKRLAERTRDELLAFPNISLVDSFGARDYEISIEVAEEALQRYGLVFDDVVRAIRVSSLDVPGGTVRADGGEILLRTVGQAYSGDDFKNIPVLTRPDGSRLLLKDIAKVVDGFTDDPLSLEFDGQPAVALRVYEVGKQSTLDIAETVHQYVDDVRVRLPEGINIAIWAEGAFYLKGRLNMLVHNSIYGLILVFGLLAMFLRPSLAIWVTIGIPISFLGAFFLMPFVGVSINLVSLFGFILVLGIVVDDAIVVGESVFTHSQLYGGAGVEASIAGSRAVAIPVTFAVLTTAVAFVPILFLPGFRGKLMEPIPYVVIATLLISLIESKLILPYHLTLCKIGGGNREELNAFQRFQRRVAGSLENFIQHRYRPFLSWGLDRRYMVLSVFIGVLAMTIGLVVGGHIGFSFFPHPPSDFIGANLEMVEGTPESHTRKVLDRMDLALQEVIADLQEQGIKHPIEHVAITMGSMPFAGGPRGRRPSPLAANRGQITLEMQKSENRAISAPEFSALWREKIGHMPGVKELSFKSRAAGGSNKPIEIQLSGYDFDRMKLAAADLKEKLAGFDGVYDILDDYTGGKRELKLDIKAEAEVLGLSQADLGRQVRAAFYGAEAQRVQRGREDVRVMVRYPEKDRRNIAMLEEMHIRTANGKEVPFYEVSNVEMGRGPSTISRVDRNRAIRIVANLDRSQGDLWQIKEQLSSEIMPALMDVYPGSVWEFKGEIGEGMDSMSSLLSGALIVLCVIYFLMAIPFKSYIQPLIIMSVIPFGLIGAVFGHVIFGKDISILSLTGMLAMAGVLVNDSLVMVDYINKQVRSGRSEKESVREAGAVRFRPIILTSLTTFAGLSPILMERSLQAQFLIPMAISLAFGVLFGTFITLLLVPSCYLILDDIKSGIQKLFGYGKVNNEG